MTSEPVLTGAGLLAVATALLTLLTTFGLHLTADQEAAVLGAVGSVAPVVVGWLVRRRVSPTAKVLPAPPPPTAPPG